VSETFLLAGPHEEVIEVEVEVEVEVEEDLAAAKRQILRELRAIRKRPSPNSKRKWMVV
jgi:hypothetical protein